MFRWLVIGSLAGLWLPLEEVRCQDLSMDGYLRSFCYNTTSGKTCFTTILLNKRLVHNSFKEARHWCSSNVPGSTFIIINTIESQTAVENFMATQELAANDTMVLNEEKPSANVSLELLWANGRPQVPRNAKHFRDGACVESEEGRSLHSCVGYVKSQDHYICEYSGTAIPYIISKDGYSVGDSSDKHCICINPQSNVDEADNDGKWWSCNCNHNNCIVCCDEEENSDAATTEIATKITPGKSVIPTAASYTSTITATGMSGEAASTSSMAKKPSNRVSDEQTPAFAEPSSPSTGIFSSFGTIEILLLLLFVAFAFIVVAIVLVIRKRKYARRYETSPLNRTDQNEAVPRGYEIMVRDNRPSGDNIYTELEVTQQPTPSSNTTYASIQPTSEVVDMGKSVDYTDIDFPLKDQQIPKSVDKGTVSVSPIYSQPFETPSSDSNTDYVEPYKPDVKPTATAHVQSHQAAADQQNVYSLAKAIPLGDPNVIYSEPNKPTKSSSPTSKPVKAPDPAYVNVIEVKPGAGSEGVATQDPTAVYAEPIKPEKSS